MQPDRQIKADLSHVPERITEAPFNQGMPATQIRAETEREESGEVSKSEYVPGEGEPRKCVACHGEDFVTLHCGHEFCKNCLIAMVDLAVRKSLRTGTANLRCPNPECDIRMDEQDVMHIKRTRGRLPRNWRKIRDIIRRDNLVLPKGAINFSKVEMAHPGMSAFEIIEKYRRGPRWSPTQPVPSVR